MFLRNFEGEEQKIKQMSGANDDKDEGEGNSGNIRIWFGNAETREW